jgi:ribonuclease HI
MAYYGVWQGRNIGIYSSWNECKEQVDGYKGAKYKKLKALSENAAKIEFFETMKLMQKEEIANSNSEKKVIQKIPLIDISLNNIINEDKKEPLSADYPQEDFLTVDGASAGQKSCEYQAVFLKSKKVAFKSKVFNGGTNNIAEFLGLVEAIKYIIKNKLLPVIYSDSVTAISWVKIQKANTTARSTGKITGELETLLQDAENFLHNNKNILSKIEIRKWKTKEWGENPADYGRK